MDIRQFSKPTDPKEAPPTPGTSLAGMRVTTPQASENQESSKKSALTLADHSEEVAPSLTDEYRAFLNDKGIDNNIIFAALDRLVTTGSFYWQFNIFNNIEVVFKVRSAYVNSYLVNEVEKEAPKTVAKFQDVVNIHNLAGSLYKYDKNSFNIEKEEEFHRALQFVRQLPYIIVQKLVKELIVFDRLMFVVGSDWAIENFTKPSSEEQEQPS